MTLEEALPIVKNIICEVNGTSVSNIKSGDSLIIDLAMDSVELIDFIIRLEEFDVTIEESQISNALTVEKIAKILINK
ncbi:acyl carrier protein [Klebsiella sp. BIGb0407]|uniref:acyl carrier protein n=1 Tax=Klebsiella sp. BIGb0407 TaxID=2940603 RepID=UPI00216776B0|nr:acyl carrier protein [Klebsiella sp. BIGb0407]